MVVYQLYKVMSIVVDLEYLGSKSSVLANESMYEEAGPRRAKRPSANTACQFFLLVFFLISFSHISAAQIRTDEPEEVRMTSQNDCFNHSFLRLVGMMTMVPNLVVRVLVMIDDHRFVVSIKKVYLKFEKIPKVVDLLSPNSYLIGQLFKKSNDRKR